MAATAPPAAIAGMGRELRSGRRHRGRARRTSSIGVRRGAAGRAVQAHGRQSFSIKKQVLLAAKRAHAMRMCVVREAAGPTASRQPEVLWVRRTRCVILRVRRVRHAGLRWPSAPVSPP